MHRAFSWRQCTVALLQQLSDLPLVVMQLSGQFLQALQSGQR